MSDAQIFNESELKECLENEQLGFQKPYPPPHDDKAYAKLHTRR